MCAVASLICLISVQRVGSQQESLPEDYAVFFGVDAQDTQSDLDNDGLTNLEESRQWTDPFARDTDADTWPDAADASVSRMYIQWGDARFTEGDEHEYTWHGWAVAAYKAGGEWAVCSTEEGSRPCWHVDASDSQPASLNIEVDRSVLTRDVVLRISFFDHKDSELSVDLYDTNDVLISERCYTDLTTCGETNATLDLNIPLQGNPDAARISIRREKGEATIWECLVYEDEDLDNLDDEQELQLLDASRGEEAALQPTETTSIPASVAPVTDAISEPGGILTESQGARVINAESGGVIHVNRELGDDTFDEVHATIVSYADKNGPKRSIAAGIAAAKAGDTVVYVAAGCYPEGTIGAPDGITVIPVGTVSLVDE